MIPLINIVEFVFIQANGVLFFMAIWEPQNGMFSHSHALYIKAQAQYSLFIKILWKGVGYHKHKGRQQVHASRLLSMNELYLLFAN